MSIGLSPGRLHYHAHTSTYQQDQLALYMRQVEVFNRSIQHDEEPIASGCDGLHVVQATMAMIESASTGRTVKLEPLSI